MELIKNKSVKVPVFNTEAFNEGDMVYVQRAKFIEYENKRKPTVTYGEPQTMKIVAIYEHILILEKENGKRMTLTADRIEGKWNITSVKHMMQES